MPYEIELLSLGENLYPVLEVAARKLNGVQGQFRYRLAESPHREGALAWTRTKYLTTDVWSFLQQQRQKFGGNRQFIIAFVNAPLDGTELGNLFGSHSAKEGIAVVTAHNSGQYVNEAARYCCYYMTRYATSFVKPSMRSHNDKARASCYFNRKVEKSQISLSLETGHICDQCRTLLDAPVPIAGDRTLSLQERKALNDMLQVVSGEYPYAIVMKGGGVKGLAFAAALVELEKYFSFNRHVGTSAGAIAAILLAANYKPMEIQSILWKKNFRDFLDARALALPFNLIVKSGLFPGEEFRLWIAGLLHEKIDKVAEIAMQDLNGALIYACRRGQGTLTFDSTGERKELPASFATRCSMSIPFFFMPMSEGGRSVYDGGIRNNFPLAKYLEGNPDKPFIALYLGKPDNRNRVPIGSELLDIVLEGEERTVVDKYRDSVVVIDTSPIGTIDFSMSDIEKDFLLKVGRAAALQFLFDRKVDGAPSAEAVSRAQQDADTARIVVSRIRRRGRRWLLFKLLMLVLTFFLIFWFHSLLWDRIASFLQGPT